LGAEHRHRRLPQHRLQRVGGEGVLSLRHLDESLRLGFLFHRGRAPYRPAARQVSFLGVSLSQTRASLAGLPFQGLSIQGLITAPTRKGMSRLKLLFFALPALVLWLADLSLTASSFSEKAEAQAAAYAVRGVDAVSVRVANRRSELQGLALRLGSAPGAWVTLDAL